VSVARPVAVRRCPESAELRITWDDGVVSALKYALLRERCRCAHCRAGRTSRSGTSVALLDVAPFGDYALRLFFDDGHDRGLYPFEYLRELCHTEAEA
jgi:DUF971 family protein